MGNRTGMILEFKGNKAIVMTSTCDFITITRMPEMFLGQQVDLSNSVIPRKSNPLKYIAIAGMFVLLFCSVLIYQLGKPSAVFAYVDVDINPSLELSIDKRAKVIEVKALNSDATALVENLRLVNMPLTSAVKNILEESQNKGFIRPDTKNAVLISASIKQGKLDSSTVSGEKVLDGIVSELQKTDFRAGSVSIKPEVIKVDPAKRSEAVKNNISMGRYKLWEDTLESDYIINIEKARSENLYNMLEAYEFKKQNKETSDKNKDNSYNTERVNDAPVVSNSIEKPDSNEKPENKKPKKYTAKESPNTKKSPSIKESPDKKETFNQGSKPIPSEYRKNAPSDNNNKKPKNNPSNGKKEKSKDNNNNQKGNGKK